MKELFQNWEAIVWSLGLLAGALILGLLLHYLLVVATDRVTQLSKTSASHRGYSSLFSLSV